MFRRMILVVIVVACCSAADWNRFRGPDASGVATETSLPKTWNAREHLAWKTPLPGYGSSSPITCGDKVFLTCYSGYGLAQQMPGQQERLAQHVLCLDRRSGKLIWEKKIEPTLPETAYDAGRISLHGYASATPVTDGESLYVFFGKTGVLRFDLDGRLIWKTDVGSELDSHNWGSAASPILFQDLVIVNASAESQSIRALKKSNGQEVWRFQGIVDSWSTPLVATTAAGSQELVVVERFSVVGLDPRTGEKLWFLEKPSDYVCPSVIADQDVVYVMNSRRNALLMAIRLGGRGDVSDSHVLWTTKWTTRVSTPVIHDGYLYGIDFLGVAYCFRLEDGEQVYRERLDVGGDGDKIYASLVAGDGKLYGVSRLDGTVVLALSPEFKLLAHNRVGDDSVFNATPAIDRGQLLLRSDRFLYCFRTE